jgi:hypothetical protein
VRTRNWFFIAFLVSIGVQSYHEIRPAPNGCGDLPWPPRLIYTGIVFALLDLFSGFNEDLAGVIAIGFVIAQVLNKGFITDCTHPEATAQTTAFDTLAGGQQLD